MLKNWIIMGVIGLCFLYDLNVLLNAFKTGDFIVTQIAGICTIFIGAVFLFNIYELGRASSGV